MSMADDEYVEALTRETPRKDPNHTTGNGRQERLDSLGRLRLPFPKEAVDLLPKPFKRDAPKGKCAPRSDGGAAPNDQDHYCGGYHGLPAMHLSYVGHAYVTERLLDVDPLWTWEPMAFDERGLPLFVVTTQGDPVALWIKLTVCGKTVIGVGTVEPGVKDPEKQLISDALRNAAMRFGVAIDMWMKSGEDDVVQDARVAGPAGVPGGVTSGPRVEGPGVQDTKPIIFPGAGQKAGVRHVFDVPITIGASYEDFKDEALGGKGKYKDSSWRDMISGDQDRLDYLENYMVEKASEAWRNLDQPSKDRGLSVYPVYQKVLLTFQEYLDRKGADSTVDLTP